MTLNPSSDKQHRAILQDIARRAMLERGLLPDFSREVFIELSQLAPAQPSETDGNGLRDLRQLLWCSIDNDDSLDLDQLTVAEVLPGERVKVLVAVADVDALVKPQTAIDRHAAHNTTSIYTAAAIFSMLPEKLSTDLTSLGFNQDRLCIVIEMVLGADGALLESDVYQALVHNHAKLAYHSVAAWLEGQAALPEAAAAVEGLAANLRLQDAMAQKMKQFRHQHGALSLESVEARTVFAGDEVEKLEEEKKDRAKELVEDFMIAANGVTARFLSAKNFPSIRRVVRTPRRWDRIVEIAAEHHFKLTETPDSKALESFLTQAKTADPARFPDLSLAIIKLIGAGEYMAELPGDPSPGHFGLAVHDYAHSTAPNRRFTDLITQRLLKAAITGSSCPYAIDTLRELAQHCTEEEDVANKVERQVSKSAAAMLLESRVGEQFDAIVTGAAAKGTWVRLLTLPVEGRLMQGYQGVDVGMRLRVQLKSVDIWQGFIDFIQVDSRGNGR
jgi:VacB/RNase II family 3'-5' exoribonuclease